jgi:hypothetical protein
MRSLSIPRAAGNVPGRLRLSCILLGHEAANRCECRSVPFAEDGCLRHIRHVMSCFLGGHHFVKLVRRLGHDEFVCHACGHQLLLGVSLSGEFSFWRRPRYVCSVFGHRVRPIGERCGLVEYVCGCGHSFMKRQPALKKIKHPLTCTLFGHFVRFLGRRNGHSEYLCRVCGHTFCYVSKTIEN